MKKIIITGANGFMGKHLAQKYLEEQCDVYCLVQKGATVNFNNAKVIEFDLDKIEEIESLLPVDADVLYHLAWAGVSTTYKNDYSIQSQNIAYTLGVLEMASRIRCKKVICPGSVSEYAISDSRVDGLSRPCPADMYSACKASARIICDMYAKQHGIDFVWALITSIYGPGREDNNIITYSIKAFLSKEKPSFTKLEQQWDYLYIDDLINALYLLGVSKTTQDTYVIGSGKEQSLAKYIEIVRDMIDPSLEMGIGELPYKTARVDNSIVDISALQRDTGFEPSVDFKEGIRRTIEYFRKK